MPPRPAGVSQPTLSAALKQIEETLGVLLVNRGSRFQGFTPEGQRVLDWARRIVGDTRTMREELRAARTGLTGHLRLAAIPTALASVARLTTPFRALHPGVTFSVQSRSTGDILAELENLELDAALGYLTPELGRARVVPLYREHYCLVIAATDKLAASARLRWADVPALPLCLLGPEMQKPPHPGRKAAGRRAIGQAHAGKQFHHRPAEPCPNRPMGEHPADRPGASLRPARDHSAGSDRGRR